jgi:hypothetical protein
MSEWRMYECNKFMKFAALNQVIHFLKLIHSSMQRLPNYCKNCNDLLRIILKYTEYWLPSLFIFDQEVILWNWWKCNACIWATSQISFKEWNHLQCIKLTGSISNWFILFKKNLFFRKSIGIGHTQRCQVALHSTFPFW